VHLIQARIVALGSLDDVTFRFGDDGGRARRTVVVLGGGGVGKTTLLAAIASTRPGHAVAQRARRPGETPYVVADWSLGAEDPARPHPLRVVTPNATLGEDEGLLLLRRREQALFDRRAAEGGYALLTFSGCRWFSRAAVLLGGADRNLLRHDPRTATTFDDATRADLSRETKQALAYPVLAAAVAQRTARVAHEVVADAESLESALRGAVEPLANLAGHAFVGVDPVTFEPMFERGRGGTVIPFDQMPTRARQLVSFAALAVRALWAAWPHTDARLAEGVALIDDAELHLDSTAQRGLVPALRHALPNVQWIVTTSSTDLALACDAADVIALRRMPESNEVRVFEGQHAIVH